MLIINKTLILTLLPACSQKPNGIEIRKLIMVPDATVEILLTRIIMV